MGQASPCAKSAVKQLNFGRLSSLGFRCFSDAGACGRLSQWDSSHKIGKTCMYPAFVFAYCNVMRGYIGYRSQQDAFGAAWMPTAPTASDPFLGDGEGGLREASNPC